MERDEQYELDSRAASSLQRARGALAAELGKTIVGQGAAIEAMLVAMLMGGHCLLTGAPGLAKTLLVKSIARAFALSFARVQFTPDLMPSDIVGTEILRESPEGRRLQFVPGPIFAHIVLADEINRTPPKTQAALLEAMQEGQVTTGGVTHALPAPFFVLATQNPLEMEGTYPLPEAQLDRFVFNVTIDYLDEADEVDMVMRTTARPAATVHPLFSGEELVAFQRLVRDVPVAPEVARYAVRLVAASRPRRPGALAFVDELVTWGAGPRAAQALVLGGKARALLAGRYHVGFEDVRALALPVMRHRVLLGYRAQAEGVTSEAIVGRLLESVPQG